MLARLGAHLTRVGAISSRLYGFERAKYNTDAVARVVEFAAQDSNNIPLLLLLDARNVSRRYPPGTPQNF